VLVAVSFKGNIANYPLPLGKWHILLANNADLTEAAAPLAPNEVRILISSE
jgi:hypothetical protein